MASRSLRHSPETALQGRFLEAAQTIAVTVRAHARSAHDGNIYWRHPVESVGQVRPAPLGPFLYAGSAGVSLFLAAAARVLMSGEFRELSLRAISPLRRQIREIVDDPARSSAIRQPIGGLSGLGSLVYAFTRIGDLLDEPSLIEDAHTVTALITPDRISADEHHDVMLGCAGAILALLALDDRKPDRNRNGVTPMELASACALHLVSERRLWRETATVWTASSGRPLPNGFCHGGAGISTALLRLYERTGEHMLWKIARQSVAYECALYVPSERNWRLHDSGDAEFANRWCKGAPGIALNRVAVLRSASDPAAAEELAIALETTGASQLSETDDLCCGNAGRIDVLLHAYRKLDAPIYLEAACDLAAGVVERARRNGYYSFRLGGVALLDLRLFTGLSGLGYSLLRLTAPDLVPCVTALD